MAQLKRGTLVRFNHERDGGPVRRIVSVAPDGMIELEDMDGFFAPHLFEIAEGIADIPPSSGYIDPEDILEGAQQRLMEQSICECPKCGRLHHKLANKPPAAIAGPSLLRPAEKPYDYRCDCCDNGLNAEWDFCPFCGKIQREEPSGLCLAGIAANKACRPDGTLKRCTICGFVVDAKYATEKPTTHLRPGKRS